MFSVSIRLPTLLLPALVAGLLAAPTASAKPGYRVGMGDQNKKMFAHKSFKALELERVRYIVSWDAGVDARQFREVGGYLLAARRARKEVLVAFGARRGCFTGRYAAAKPCRAPGLRAYRSAFRAFRKRYPWVKTFSPWNEANHVSQPTYRRPGLAAAYYDQVRRNCRGCKIVALDVLDSRNMLAYIGGFVRGTKGKPRIWGIHNYADVNRLRSSATRAILSRVPGEVWMTETGGLVAFGPSFPYDQRRAASRTHRMFRLADAYDTRRSGMRSRITRLYPYQWTGVKRGARFDAGLVSPSGSPPAGALGLQAVRAPTAEVELAPQLRITH